MREAVIVSSVRTPVGKAFKGSLRSTRPDDLAAVAIQEAIRRVPGLKADDAIALFQSKLAEHKKYVVSHGEDMPEVVSWRWSQG